MPTLTDEHKRAMAEGRRQARAVKNFLEALDASRKRGPKPDPDKIKVRIDAASAAIEAEDDPATRLELIQQRIDDQQQLDALADQDSIEDLEGDFVDVVAAYSDRKGISYAAWREIGVPAATLRAGGLTPRQLTVQCSTSSPAGRAGPWCCMTMPPRPLARKS